MGELNEENQSQHSVKIRFIHREIGGDSSLRQGVYKRDRFRIKTTLEMPQKHRIASNLLKKELQLHLVSPPYKNNTGSLSYTTVARLFSCIL